MRPQNLWTLGLCATLLAACATGNASRSRVTKITYSAIPKVKISSSPIGPEPPPGGVTPPTSNSIVEVAGSVGPIISGFFPFGVTPPAEDSIVEVSGSVGPIILGFFPIGVTPPVEDSIVEVAGPVGPIMPTAFLLGVAPRASDSIVSVTGSVGFFLQRDRAQGALRTLGAPISTEEALKQAQIWTIEGLRRYARGEIEPAHKSLALARLMFREAALPENLKEQGLSFFRQFLSEELRRYDPDDVAKRLDREDLPSIHDMEERALAEKEVLSVLWPFGHPTPEDRYAPEIIKQTQEYIHFFCGPWRKFFEHSLLRKYKYWKTVQDVFAEKKVPLDFGYLAFVESGFQPRAVSTANAKGLWQFISETGRRYGLERREDFYDARKSTDAAASYLLELSNIFGSRLLAIAAYNAGEGKIIGCLRKLDDSRKRSFWEIRSCLKGETRDYVPKVLAVAVIGAEPKRFGFPTEEETLRKYDVVVVPRITPLAYLASLAGVTVDYLREKNSDLSSTATETPGRNFPLYVPKDTGAPLIAALTLAPEERKPSIAPMSPSEIAPHR